MPIDYTKEVLEGYKIIQNVTLAGGEYIVSETPNPDSPYAMWTRGPSSQNGLESLFEGSYIEAMKKLTEQLQAQIDIIIEFAQEINDKPLTIADCVKDSDKMDFKDQFVVIKPEAVAPEYKMPAYQVMRAVGGFGCSPNARGQTVYCEDLLTWMTEAYQRSDIAGIADIEKMPDYVEDLISEYLENRENDEPDPVR